MNIEINKDFSLDQINHFAKNLFNLQEFHFGHKISFKEVFKFLTGYKTRTKGARQSL